MGPGFDFEDFTILANDAASTVRLLALDPELASLDLNGTPRQRYRARALGRRLSNYLLRATSTASAGRAS